MCVPRSRYRTARVDLAGRLGCVGSRDERTLMIKRVGTAVAGEHLLASRAYGSNRRRRQRVDESIIERVTRSVPALFTTQARQRTQAVPMHIMTTTGSLGRRSPDTVGRVRLWGVPKLAGSEQPHTAEIAA